jgi:cation:H+ antiporter
MTAMPFWLAIVLGFGLLTAGAEFLIRGASNLAFKWGISPLAIGLTVVACGTGAPEAIVSIDAALSGRSEIALGNVLGSNLFNVLVILGASALVAPLIVSRQLLRVDVPILIGLSGATWMMALDGTIGWIDSTILAASFVAYTVLSVRLGRKIPTEAVDVPARTSKAWPWQVLGVLGGLALLGVGARWFVDGSVDLARRLGVSELVIGLTLVAAGTSLPEMATSILSSIRGERDIAVGNIVGSNIFNLVGVLGPTGLVAGGVPVPDACLRVDFPAMAAVAAACLPIFLTGSRISRWEGALLVSAYAGYVAVLIRGSPAAP